MRTSCPILGGLHDVATGMLLSCTACRIGGTGRPESADSLNKSIVQAQGRALCIIITMHHDSAGLLASLHWLIRLATQTAMILL